MTDLRLDLRNAPWLADPAVARVLNAFAPMDQPRFVGGCVRNALIGGGATDLDIAVVCRPEQTMARLEAAGLKAIPTGVEHGTVTTVAELEQGDAKGEPIEITTLREDVETDGRRAVVAFTDDWAADAARRDFTMNALYAEADGRVIDPLGGGVQDLMSRHVRFIGQPEERIREDYLRILRYFRFFAWYGRAAPEREDVAAIEQLKGGVSRLARERIGHETRKLLAAPDPTAAFELMRATGVDECVYGAPLTQTSAAWRSLLAAEHALALPSSWIRRALFVFHNRRADLTGLLRLSKAETAAFDHRATALELTPEVAAYRFGADAALDAALVAAALNQSALACGLPDQLTRAAALQLPVSAQDLIAAGVKPGPALGAALRAAEERWLESGFALDRDTLVSAIARTGD
ncbi:MAG: CCA tRNA nucleotidyltransferase [Neomegalonema sp.]|nr:CCA tRNA nucleotidyltransferase [Neomegalonema sp.]